MSAEARNNIRSAIFSQKPRSKIIKVAGADVELRQPLLGQLYAELETDVVESTNKKSIVVKMLLDYCYVPGTDEKVFEDTDKEALMALPFNKDWQDLQTEINSLLDLDESLKAARKNSDETT